jgi:Domain of unknown function (DUF5658)
LNHLLLQFAYLQLLDLMTTVAFLVNGIQEANPLVRLVIDRSHNPISALIAVKVLAVLLGAYCWRMGRERVLTRMNLLFAVVVAWNLGALIVGSIHSIR